MTCFLDPTATGQILTELDFRLEGVRLFRREEEIERVLRILDFPRLTPRTLLLLGEPALAKARFLTSFSGLFHGQQLPVSTVVCPPDRQSIPYSTVVAILANFLHTYPPSRIEQWVGPTLHMNPWLAWLFRTLQVEGTPPIPPEDVRALRHGLESMMMGILREAPHLAIVHNMQRADADSLDLLVEIQERPRHGLRLLATADPEGDELLPTILQPFRALGASTFELPPLSPDDHIAYIEEFAVELAESTIAEALYQHAQGLPLDMERVLRTWTLNGTLTVDEGIWAFNAPSDETDDEAATCIDEETLTIRLGQTALVGTTSVAFLALLWDESIEAATELIQRGRYLGHLAPPPADIPDLVEFADLDQLAYFEHVLTPEQQSETHRRVVDLLENAAVQQKLPETKVPPPQIAYHMLAAGLDDEAKTYLRAAQLSQHRLADTSGTLPPLPEQTGLQHWDLLPPAEVTDDVQGHIIAAAIAMRLAGVQYRLYPLHAEPVAERTTQAMAALDRLFAERPSLIITCDGKTVAFDGVHVQRSDVAYAERDYLRWMKEGCLHAIGITRGIRREELARFLYTFVNHEPKEGHVALLSKIAALNLVNIKVHTGYFSAPALAESDEDDGEYTETLTHDNIMAFLHTGITPDDAIACLAHMMPEDEADEDIPDPQQEPFAITREHWPEFTVMLSRASAHVRRLLTASVTQWFRPEMDPQQAEQLPENFDNVLGERVVHESDEDTVADLTTFMRRRLDYLLERKRWQGVMSYLPAAKRRHIEDTNPRLHHLLGDLITDVAESESFHDAFEDLEDTQEMLDQLHTLVDTLGVLAIRPLLTRLSQSTSARERLTLVQQLSVLCQNYHQLLVHELKEENPWYYYRNVLTILGSVGQESSIAAVSEKILHSDPRVRAEAVATAVTLVGERATSYVARGLQDADPQVRERAAIAAKHCQDARICDLLIGLVRNTKLFRSEPEAVQVAACSSLGQYTDAAARRALCHVVRGRALSAYWPRPEGVRLAALQALEPQMDDPKARAVVKKLLRHRNPLIMHTARKLLG